MYCDTFSSHLRQRAASSAAQNKRAAAASHTSQRIFMVVFSSPKTFLNIFLCISAPRSRGKDLLCRIWRGAGDDQKQFWKDNYYGNGLAIASSDLSSVYLRLLLVCRSLLLLSTLCRRSSAPFPFCYANLVLDQSKSLPSPTQNAIFADISTLS